MFSSQRIGRLKRLVAVACVILTMLSVVRSFCLQKVSCFTFTRALSTLPRKPALDISWKCYAARNADRAHFSTKRSKFQPDKKKIIEKQKSRKEQKAIDDEAIDPTTLIEGRVLERRSDRLLVDYAVPSSGQRAQLLCLQRQHFQSLAEHIVPGDIVRFTFGPVNNATQVPELGIVQEMAPRLNVLQRPSASSSKHNVILKPIAANIDQLCVIVSTQPTVPIQTIDRYLVSALAYDIPSVSLVVNKADLSDTAALHRSLLHYEQLGHTVILASTKTQHGLDELRKLLRGKVTVFVGQSGVGKTSLLNALLPSIDAKVGGLVGNEQFGAHTTSTARMYFIDEADRDAGAIVDSPGVRELGIWHLDRALVQSGFTEIDAASKHCRFRDCHHDWDRDSAHCGVVQAVQRGEIHAVRYKSFLALRDQQPR